MIILAPREEEIANLSRSESIDSPLLLHYQKLVAAKQPSPVSRDVDQKHAQEVIAKVNSLRGVAEARSFGFKQSVRRLELLSSDLIDERSEEASHDS